MEHELALENREMLTVTAVTDIKNFDDEGVDIVLEDGGLRVRGRGLKISLLDLEEGRAMISGRIDSMGYIRAKSPAKFLSRIFGKRRC